MAQASSNAQREPSMEEILASIRRIIEDSDAAGAAAEKGGENQAETSASAEVKGAQAPEEEAHSLSQDDESAAAQPAESASAEAEQADETSEEVTEEVAEEPAPEAAVTVSTDEEVQAFREELSGDGAVGAADEAKTELESVEPDNPMSVLSLADIQAEVASQTSLSAEDSEPEGTPAATQLARGEDAGTETLAQEEETDTEPFAGKEKIAAEPLTGGEEVETKPVAKETEPEEAVAVEAQQEEDVSEPVDEDTGDNNSLSALADAITSEALSDKAEEELASSHVPELPASTDDIAAQHSAPIVSEQVGKQVAAAFDELNEAFSQPNPENFDRIAEAMMRPMLQEWLDNNLPVLVERLVREEIDRVARGASR